jgi:O-methyltransferase domain/Dimerisation domain
MTPSEPSPQQVPPPVALHRLMSGHWIAQAIFVAAQLGVADYLTDGPQHADALAQSVGAHPGALYRLLRALASVGVFTEIAPQRFALTPIGTSLQTGITGSLHALALTGNVLDWEAWGQLLYCVKTGEPAFQHVHGMDPFTYFQHHPEVGKIFDEAMTGFVTENSLAVVTAYDFTPFTTIVDVGGGHGALMVAILQASPATRGVILELPSVLDGARATLEAAGLLSRCDCVAGDFFASVPAGGDAYILASIIHDWDTERSLTILRNCRRAMTNDAKLLLEEMVIPPGDAPFFGKWLDLEMLACFGGQERTEAEYQALLAAAGFQLTRIVPTHTPSSVIEAVPVS